jgi:signal transduction histidine kinase
MSYFKFMVVEERITVFGLRSTLSKDTGNKVLKEALKGRTANLEEIRDWINCLNSLLDAISADFVRRQAEMLEPLHDPMRLVRQVLKLSQSMAIAATRAQSIDEALSRASPDMKSLVKAADFLNESFDMLTIYFNPDAAAFPRRYSFSLYGMLKKIVSVFSIDDDSDAAPRAAVIYLNGNSYRKVQLRENFKLVPFALITNAIKYSVEGDIQVTISDRASTTEVAVESIGPPIELDEIPQIFNKKFRGKWAKMHSAGTGVGLFLADVIARANGFQILVSSKPTGRFRGSVPLASNRFWFEVPSR